MLTSLHTTILSDYFFVQLVVQETLTNYFHCAYFGFRGSYAYFLFYFLTSV